MEKRTKVNRIINFYELHFEFKKEFIEGNNNETGYVTLFNKIEELNTSMNKNRFVNAGEKLLLFKQVSINEEKSQIQGKLISIRNDLFPELLNTKTDSTKGIEALEEEGIAETSHFLIDLKSNNVWIGIEYNQFGARFNDFIHFIEHFNYEYNLIEKVVYKLAIRDSLEEMKKRIGALSEINITILKENINQILEIDKSIYEAAKLSIDHFNAEYVDLRIKIDSTLSNPKSTGFLNKVFNIFKDDKKKIDNFDKLTIKAKDALKNNTLQVFDLLLDKVSSEIKVEKVPRYKTIVSIDMYNQLKIEMLKNKK